MQFLEYHDSIFYHQHFAPRFHRNVLCESQPLFPKLHCSLSNIICRNQIGCPAQHIRSLTSFFFFKGIFCYNIFVFFLDFVFSKMLHSSSSMFTPCPPFCIVFYIVSFRFFTWLNDSFPKTVTTFFPISTAFATAPSASFLLCVLCSFLIHASHHVNCFPPWLFVPLPLVPCITSIFNIFFQEIYPSASVYDCFCNISSGCYHIFLHFHCIFQHVCCINVVCS